jgi:hypothetical protein
MSGTLAGALAAMMTGVGALLAGIAAMRKAKQEGAAVAHEDCRELLVLIFGEREIPEHVYERLPPQLR